MAEGLTESSSKSTNGDGAAAPSTDSLFHRKIEFHLARKPYSPVSGGDFHLETLNPSSSETQRPAVPTQGGLSSVTQGKRANGGGGFYEHGLDPELSFGITFRRIGAGLANLGNTCFLNSVLQCLTYTEPFAAYLQSGKHKSSCRTAGFCAMCALQNHVMSALQSTGKILSPSHLVKNLRCISRNFRNSRQEDAHEYMVNLLESMHKCCLPSGVPTESPSAYDKSLVHKIFGGRLRSQVKCMQCSYCSNKFDPFLDLSLEIVKADSLRKALSHFTAVEQLDGGERQYQCQRCKEKVRALKQLTVHKAPHVLTIHLKRFGPDIPGQKIDKKVEFDPTLDLKSFVSDPQEADLKYTLYGVLVHAGWSTHSGHYYCFVRTSSGMWHSLDDNQVFQVSEKTVLAQKAYMLFYVRDRSSAIKRSVNVVRKDNCSAISRGSKAITRSACSLDGVIQNGALERKLTTLGCSSAEVKTVSNFHTKRTSVTGNSPGQTLCNGDSSLQKNNNTTRIEAPHLQSNGVVTLKEDSSLQSNGNVKSKELQQTTVSKDPKNISLENPLAKMPLVVESTDKQKVTDKLAQPAQLKDNRVANTFCANNSPLTKSGQTCHESFQPSHGDGKCVSGSSSAQPNNFVFQNPSSEKDTSVHQNGGTTNEISKNTGTSCKVDSVSTTINSEPTNGFGESSHVGGCIHKKPYIETCAEDQNICPELDKYTSNLHCQNSGGSLLKSGETGSINLMKMPISANGCVPQEALPLIVTKNALGDCSNTELTRKKLAKSLMKGPYFGRKQLFFTSLRLCKSKKHKRSKKCCANFGNIIKDKIREDTNKDCQGASTSEAVRTDASVSARSSKKRSHSSSNKEYTLEGVKDVNYCNGGFIRANDRTSEGSSKTDVLAPSEQPRRSVSFAANQCHTRETDANGKGLVPNGAKRPVPNGATSLLTSLKEAKVPLWDDIELPLPQSHKLGDAGRKNIGYVPTDEWDEEYDRGKRKKVKQSKSFFAGSNRFQELSSMKIQQKMVTKVNLTRSGNRPFRI